MTEKEEEKEEEVEEEEETANKKNEIKLLYGEDANMQ